MHHVTAATSSPSSLACRVFTALQHRRQRGDMCSQRVHALGILARCRREPPDQRAHRCQLAGVVLRVRRRRAGARASISRGNSSNDSSASTLACAGATYDGTTPPLVIVGGGFRRRATTPRMAPSLMVSIALLSCSAIVTVSLSILSTSVNERLNAIESHLGALVAQKTLHMDTRLGTSASTPAASTRTPSITSPAPVAPRQYTHARALSSDWRRAREPLTSRRCRSCRRRRMRAHCGNAAVSIAGRSCSTWWRRSTRQRARWRRGRNTARPSASPWPRTARSRRCSCTCTQRPRLLVQRLKCPRRECNHKNNAHWYALHVKDGHSQQIAQTQLQPCFSRHRVVRWTCASPAVI